MVVPPMRSGNVPVGKETRPPARRAALAHGSVEYADQEQTRKTAPRHIRDLCATRCDSVEGGALVLRDGVLEAAAQRHHCRVALLKLVSSAHLSEDAGRLLAWCCDLCVEFASFSRLRGGKARGLNV